jgi:hypothetical protein
MGPFVEPPILAWDEIIMFNDYAKGERYEVVANMYAHKPASPTVAVWGQRYFRAFLDAKGTPFTGNIKGHSKLLDKNGVAVKANALPTCGPKEFDKMNKAVQDYLKRNGGILEIEVHDIPGIALEAGKARDLERVLIFNCGVTGLGARVKAWQHIRIAPTHPMGSTRRFELAGNPPGLKTTGLKLDPSPYAGIPNNTPAEGAIKET